MFLFQLIGGYIMDFNNDDNSNLDNNETYNAQDNNQNNYPNDTYQSGQFNNEQPNNNSSNDGFNNVPGNDYNNGYNNYNNNYNNNNYNNNFNNNYNNNSNPNNGTAIAALILGILSIPLSCCYGLGAILAIIGIIFGIVSRKYNGNKLSGLALAGIICSALGLISSAIVLVGVISFFTNVDSEQFNEMFRAFQDLEGNNNSF